MLTKTALFKNVGNILKSGNLGDDNYGVADLDGVVSTGNDNLAITKDSGYKHVLSEAELRDRNADDGRGLSDDKLGCLDLALDDVIESLHIASARVLRASYVSYDHIGYDGLRVDDRVEIETVDHAIVIHTRHLGNNLASCLFFCVHGEDHVFLVRIGERKERADSADALLSQDLLVGGIAVYYGDVREGGADLVAERSVSLDDLDIGLALFEDGAEVVCYFTRADDKCALNALVLRAYLLKEVLRALGRGDDRHDIACLKDKVTLCDE